jgi:hypothetical protein
MRRRCFILVGLAAFSRELLYAAKFPEYPVKAAKEYPGAITVEGLIVGVTPMADPDEQQRYFGLNFSKNNFLPVLVVVENGSTADSFILNRELIAIYAGEEEQAGPGHSDLGNPSKTARRVELASAVTLSIAAGVVASVMMMKAADIKQNLIKKELRSSTLSPGQKCGGFVFVPIPSDLEKRAHLRMRVQAMKIGSERPSDFEFPI